VSKHLFSGDVRATRESIAAALHQPLLNFRLRHRLWKKNNVDPALGDACAGTLYIAAAARCDTPLAAIFAL
jgi:hypothetical protein